MIPIYNTTYYGITERVCSKACAMKPDCFVFAFGSTICHLGVEDDPEYPRIFIKVK